MFQRGKPKLLGVLVVVLGLSLASAGCETDTGSTRSMSAAMGNGFVYPGTGPAGAKMPGGNNVVQAGYVGDDAKGQPIVGAPGTPGPVGPGCGPNGCPGSGFDGPGPIPTELNKVSLPPYTVAPPDILFIDSSRLIPKPPYHVEPLEVLLIQVTDTLPNQPINGPFVVTPEGTVNLGYSYGTVRVQGLTIDQIQKSIREHLGSVLRNPQVSVSLGAFRAIQQTRGEHLVRPDGTISLGTYGSVYVAGMTLGQIKCVIERHLSEYVVNPQIAVDVYSYNSKYYYVIFSGGGYGQQIIKMPVTGNETVLDAIANVQGMPPVASIRRLWIARPAPCGHACDQILPIDWRAITEGGSTCTNYQLLPGDRIYVKADCLIELDNWLAKIISPIERVLGVTLLGTTTVESFNTNGNGNNGGGAFLFTGR